MGSRSPDMLLARAWERIRLKHGNLRTERACCNLIRRSVALHRKRYPASLGAGEVEAFLTALAVDGKIAASTPNQAKSALLFLGKEGLAVERPWLDGIDTAKAPRRPPGLALTTPTRAQREGLRTHAFALSQSANAATGAGSSNTRAAPSARRRDCASRQPRSLASRAAIAT